MSKNTELKELSLEELHSKLEEVIEESDKLRMTPRDKIKDTTQAKHIRRQRARILTFINQQHKAKSDKQKSDK